MKRFCSILMLAIFCLAGCGGNHDRRSIMAADPITQHSLTINIKVKNAVFGSCTHFASEKDIKKLAAEISKSDSSLKTELFREKYIMITQQSGAEHIFLIKPMEEKQEPDAESETRYALFAPAAAFQINKPGDTNLLVHIPYHLTDIGNVQYTPDYDSPYPNGLLCGTSFGREEFSRFYSSLGYAVQENEDGLAVACRDTAYRLKIDFSAEGKVTFAIE